MADQIGRMVVSATLPEDLANAHDGRLWVRVGYFASRTKPSPQLAVSFMQFGLSEIGRAVALDPEQVIAAKNGLIGQQQARIAELEGLLKAMYASRSWRVTAPLRKFRVWLRH